VTFRFTGDLTAVTFVDRGITGQEPATIPNVHVDYGVPTQEPIATSIDGPPYERRQ